MSASAAISRSISWVLPLFVVVGVAAGSPFAPTAAAESQVNATATAPDITKLGPQVGEKVPDFSLLDQHGARRTLASLMGPKGLVLVFNRSADW
jgi:hypothetical protein